MPQPNFPLRWESTGDQWWFASPIDWAAANGHYDLVRELLHLDTNLLIKLTSLRRIRRLETVWDDDEEGQFNGVAKCRCEVAKKLLLECESREGPNSLIGAGYGGWLLYTAASAGDVGFVKGLLERDPLLVFGEGEYGVTDILYAAARGKSPEVFRVLLDSSLSPRQSGEDFHSEMMNRAVHAAARGGNVEVLKELLENCSDVLVYRDSMGSTLLHSAASRGQVEVVKSMLASYDIIDSKDNQGNTALHIAAYRGYLSTVKILISALPSSATLTNNFGETFLHMAVSGFRTPGFHRLDRQIELIEQLVRGKIVDIEDIINLRNNEGKTALHVAVAENVRTDLVELLMSAFSIDLNIRDANGHTPLDLLKQRPRSASSEILIKRLISAGGISGFRDRRSQSALASHLKMQGILRSPGTSFRIPDAEIFLCTGIERGCNSYCSFAKSEHEISPCRSDDGSNFSSPTRKLISAARRLKFLLRWQKKKEAADGDFEDNDSVESYTVDSSSVGDKPIPLRQRFSRISSLPNSKRILSFYPSSPSPSSKMKFSAGLRQGVIQFTPRSPGGSPSSPLSTSIEGSSCASPNLVTRENLGSGASGSKRFQSGQKSKLGQKHNSFNMKVMNQLFCFGTEGLAVSNPTSIKPQDQYYKHAVAT